MPEDLKISLPLFEGPLDLLLDMIRRQKLDIYDIPIAKVTEQYLSYIRLMQELNIDVASASIVRISIPTRETRTNTSTTRPLSAEISTARPRRGARQSVFRTSEP